VYLNSEDAAINSCPYGQPGDLLWVREAWQPVWAEADEPAPEGLRSKEGWSIGYAADQIVDWYDGESLTSRCKPSIHMPRWASRLTLEITDVRVQRLQEISEKDALAEGIEPRCWLGQSTPLPPVASFRGLWESVNGPESWAENPWTWALTFKVHHQNIDDFLQMREAA
jgi:hypothetical protein